MERASGGRQLYKKGEAALNFLVPRRAGRRANESNGNHLRLSTHKRMAIAHRKREREREAQAGEPASSGQQYP